MHKIEEIEKALNLLDTYDGQLSKTARALGINRYTLRSWRDKRKKVCTPLEALSLYQTCRSNMAEQQGFEPWLSLRPLLVFETSPFNLLGTAPCSHGTISA